MSDENNQPMQPDGVLANVLNDLVEIKASMAVLQARLQAQERLILATALALPLGQRVAYLQMATALQLNALAVGDAVPARLMTGQLERWQAICGDDLQAPQAKALLTVRSETLLFANVPKHLKASQEQWLAIASPEEIAQELAELLPVGRAQGVVAGALPQKKTRAGVRQKKKPSGD